jgi:mRNA interferase RelE/StbE
MNGMSEPFDIRYAALAAADVRALRAFDQRKVLDAIEEHLTYEPKRTSKSRIKAMEQPFWSQFRLRVDDCRVYYDVDGENRVVHVLRVLKKGTEPTPQDPTENRTNDENRDVDR